MSYVEYLQRRDRRTQAARASQLSHHRPAGESFRDRKRSGRAIVDIAMRNTPTPTGVAAGAVLSIERRFAKFRHFCKSEYNVSSRILGYLISAREVIKATESSLE